MEQIIVVAFMALSIVFVWTRAEWKDLQELKIERFRLELQEELDELQREAV